MYMISSPFICSIPKALSDVQLELIDLQSNAVLAEHFKSGFCLGLFRLALASLYWILLPDL